MIAEPIDEARASRDRYRSIPTELDRVRGARRAERKRQERALAAIHGYDGETPDEPRRNRSERPHVALNASQADPAPQAPAREDANRCGRTVDELRLAEVRAARWHAMEVLWRLSARKRGRHCRRIRANGHEVITIDRTEGRASIGGTQTCGSVWSCACCCARILGGRTEDLVQALVKHRARGGSVVMTTFTLQHRSRHALADLWEVLQYAWKAARGGNRSSRNALAAAGSVGWVRNVEATHGANGWHLHVHALVFLDARHRVSHDTPSRLPVWRVGAPGPDAVRALGSTMFNAWRGAVKRVRDTVQDVWPEHAIASMGLPSDAHGWDARLIDLDDAVGEVAGYLAKGEYTGATSASLELTAGGKVGRGKRNRTPMQILADLVDGELYDDLVLFNEWERASKGRRMMTWSDGLRDGLELGTETDDQELAEEGDAEETLVGISPRGYAQVTGVRGRVVKLLKTAEAIPDRVGAAWAVVDLLTEWGLWSEIRDVLGCGEDEPPPRPLTSMRRPHGSLRDRLGIGDVPKQQPLVYGIVPARDRYR